VQNNLEYEHVGQFLSKKLRDLAGGYGG